MSNERATVKKGNYELEISLTRNTFSGHTMKVVVKNLKTGNMHTHSEQAGVADFNNLTALAEKSQQDFYQLIADLSVA